MLKIRIYVLTIVWQLKYGLEKCVCSFFHHQPASLIASRLGRVLSACTIQIPKPNKFCFVANKVDFICVCLLSQVSYIFVLITHRIRIRTHLNSTEAIHESNEKMTRISIKLLPHFQLCLNTMKILTI